MDNVKSFSISASVPASCDVRFAFSFDGWNWFRLSTSGTASSILTGNISYEAVNNSGNTIAELRASTTFPHSFTSLSESPRLSSDDPDNAKPSVKLSVNGSVSSQTASFTEYSPVYSLGGIYTISDIPFSTETSGGGTVNVSGKITRDDGSESEWLPASMLKGLKASAIQLKADYYSPNPGNTSAALSNIYVKYIKSSSGAPVSNGRIYTLTKDWLMNIKSVRVSIRHSPLDQSSLNVYAAFRKTPGHAVKESLGISPAGRKTYELAHKNGIRYDSFVLYADSQEISAGYELNCEAGRVTLSAPEGSVITCSYDYGYEKEIWRPMTLYSRYSLDDCDISEYRITIDDSDNFSAGAVMIETVCQSGRVGSEWLGIATGSAQTFRLNHRASEVPHVEYGSPQKNEAQLSRKNYALLNDARLIRIAAPAGKTIRCAYNWLSEPVQIYQLCAVYYD